MCWMLLFILWTTLIFSFVAAQVEDQCYAHEKHPYMMFSTFTPYALVHEKSANPVYIPQCRPLQLWLLSRHGTRYSSKRSIAYMWKLLDLRNKIITNHKTIQYLGGRLCVQDLENLRKWTPQAVSTLSMNLTPQGYEDIYKMAQRFKTRFPTLLNLSYGHDLFEVRFTKTQRTTLSAYAFVEGVFGSTSDVMLPDPMPHDTLLMPYSRCKAWKKEVEHGKDILRERKEFENGHDFKTLRQSVSGRLGFDYELSVDTLDIMYSTCRLQKAWHLNEISPWCAVFTEEELQILEYREDLEYYYFLGYGNEMSEKIGCPLVRDFLIRFSELENGKKGPVGVFYFSHDTMLQLFFTSLGIARDNEPLTHSNYQKMKNRQWKTSLVTPFGGNFAAVFFKCDAGEPYRVQFYLNEHLINLEGCKQGICNWSHIKKKYSSISEKCTLSFC